MKLGSELRHAVPGTPSEKQAHNNPFSLSQFFRIFKIIKVDFLQKKSVI